LFKLSLVKSPHIVDCLTKRTQHAAVGALSTTTEVTLTDSQVIQLYLIEPSCIFEQRSITSHSHTIDNRRDLAHQIGVERN
jgi:hypothetical protein